MFCGVDWNRFLTTAQVRSLLAVLDPVRVGVGGAGAENCLSPIVENVLQK